ncbi:hypothetical protein AB0L99_42545 [Streptomyces sp. NPDC051954]|uniref:hypothetical protein n=1 Tax=Streptomyces sp. NPDC051954 TaxID=3155524 RepID=UPI00342C8300
MTLFLSGMRITADRLNDYTPDAETASGLVAATNFSVNSFYATRTKGVVFMHVYCLYSGATITATSGNIADTAMATLPAGWRPPTTMTAIWGDGSEDGECTIGTGGIITLRTATASIPSGRNIRMTTSFNLDP